MHGFHFLRPFVWLIILAFVMPAQALQNEKKTDDWGTFFEPYFGYMSSSTSGIVKETGNEIKYADNGLAAGARLGYLFEKGFFLAADYMRQWNTTVAQENPSESHFGSRTLIFLDLGYKRPKAFWSFMLGLGFYNTWDIVRDSGDINYTGSAYKAGLGIRLAKHIALNFEYIHHEFSIVRFPGQRATSVADTYNNWKASSYFITLSIPFNHFIDYP